MEVTTCLCPSQINVVVASLKCQGSNPKIEPSQHFSHLCFYLIRLSELKHCKVLFIQLIIKKLSKDALIFKHQAKSSILSTIFNLIVNIFDILMCFIFLSCDVRSTYICALISAKYFRKSDDQTSLSTFYLHINNVPAII